MMVERLHLLLALLLCLLLFAFGKREKECYGNGCVIYDDLRKFRDTCIKGVNTKILNSFSDIVSPTSHSHVIYVGPSFHDNLGDNFLVIGSMKLFSALHATVKFCADPQSRSRIAYCDDNDIVKILKSNTNGFIYYHPGTEVVCS